MSEKHQECSECGKPLAHRVHSPTYGTHAYREPVASPQATRHVIDHTTCINVEDEIEYMKWIDKRNAAQPVAGTTPQGMVTAIGIFNSGFLQHVSTTRLDAEAWARHHLADSPEVEIKRMTFYPAPDPPEPSKGTTPQAERPELGTCETKHNSVFVGGHKRTPSCLNWRAVAPVETPEVELQTLLDAGFNGFAVQLLAEELTRKKDFDTWKTPIKFTFRGVRFTLEKVL